MQAGWVQNNSAVDGMLREESCAVELWNPHLQNDGWLGTGEAGQPEECRLQLLQVLKASPFPPEDKLVLKRQGFDVKKYKEQLATLTNWIVFTKHHVWLIALWIFIRSCWQWGEGVVNKYVWYANTFVIRRLCQKMLCVLACKGWWCKEYGSRVQLETSSLVLFARYFWRWLRMAGNEKFGKTFFIDPSLPQLFCCKTQLWWAECGIYPPQESPEVFIAHLHQ